MKRFFPIWIITAFWMGAIFQWVGPARASTPYPDFTSATLYVSDVEDRYGTLRAKLGQINAASPYVFYVVIVASSGEGPRATRDYTTGLMQFWQMTAGSDGSRFDSDRAILVVLAVQNRQISVHPSAPIRDRHGLTGTVIDRELVQPHFIPEAKQGRLGQGLLNLVIAMQNRLTAQKTRVAEEPPAQTQTAPAVTGSVPMPKSAPPQPKKGLFSLSTAAVAAAVLVLLVVAWIVFGRRQILKKRQRQHQALQSDFETFDRRVVAIMERLESIQERHQLLPYSDADFKVPMRGETLSSYRQLETQLAQLQEAWLALMDKRAAVEEIVAAPGFPDAAQIERARELMTDDDAVSTTEANIDSCNGQLDILAQAHESSMAMLAQVRARLTETAPRVTRIAAADLETLPIQIALDDCRENLAQLEELVAADPIGSRVALEELQAKIGAVDQSIQRILACHDETRQVTADIDRTASQAEQKRQQGLRLLEESGNPDPYLQQAHNDVQAALLALNRGDAEGAETFITQARQLADQAKAAMTQHVRARDYTRTHIPQRKQDHTKLQDLLQHSSAVFTQLKTAHDPAAWHDVADNANRATTLLASAQPLVSEAEQAATDKLQQYQHAADLLAHAGRQYDDIRSLLTAASDRLTELEQLRDQVRNDWQKQKNELGRLTDLMAAAPGSISQTTRRQFETLQNSTDQIDTAMDATRPNWFLLDVQLRQINEELPAIEAEADEDIRSHRAYLDQRDSVTDRLTRLGQLLATHIEDRPRANHTYENARNAWDQIQGEAATAGADWPTLLRRLQTVSNDVDQSRQWAEADISLARQAMDALRAARQTLQSSGIGFKMGGSVDLYDARTQLEDAQRALNAKDYEQALQLAANAVQSAQAAAERARLKLRQRQQQQRRRRMQQAAAAAAMAATMMGRKRRGRRGGLRRGGPLFGGPTATRPWTGTGDQPDTTTPWDSDDTSQSNW